MKVLLFCFNFGGSSSGNITKEIADALFEKGFDLLVVCGRDFSNAKQYKVLKISPFPLSPARGFKLLGDLLGIELNYIFWELRCILKFNKINKKFSPDIVYSRGSPVTSMSVGYWFSKKFDKPLFLHFADPIPATSEWVRSKLERRKLIKTVYKPLLHSKGVSFVNEEMLNYQEFQIPLINFKSKSTIIPNHILNIKTFGKPNHNKKVFLFLGTFSNQRNPSLIIESFLSVFSKCKDIEFHIYGNNRSTDAFKIYSNKSERLKFFDSIQDFFSIISQSFVLVDIDSNYPEQVFLSGKLMNYLSTDRYILSITPPNSPASKLLKDLPCVRTVTHDSSFISNAIFEFSTLEYDQTSFFKRKKISKNFLIDFVTNNIITEFKNRTS